MNGETPLSANGTLLVILTPVNDPPVLQLFEFGKNTIPPSHVVHVTAPYNPSGTTYTPLVFLLAAYDVDYFFDVDAVLKIEFLAPLHGTISSPTPQMTSLMLPQDCSKPWDERRMPWDTLVEMISAELDNISIPNPCDTQLIQSPEIMWVTTLLSYTPHVGYDGVDEIKVRNYVANSDATEGMFMV